MAIESNFGFTNKTDAKSSITPTALGVVTNYALVEDEPTRCVITNKTAPVDQGERVSYSVTPLKSVSTDQDILYPARVQNAVQYQVRIEEILTDTSTTDPTFRVDQPIVAWLTIRHPMSSDITDEVLQTVLKRLLGACVKGDGSLRFSDLMRSALKPTVD